MRKISVLYEVSDLITLKIKDDATKEEMLDSVYAVIPLDGHIVNIYDDDTDECLYEEG